MKKILIGMTMCLIGALLFVSILDSASPVMWVASSSLFFTVARTAMLIMLAVLLFTNPPRALLVRISAMGFGLGMSIAAVVMVLTYQINFLDAVVMLEVGIICMIEAFEAELYEEFSVIDSIKSTLKRRVDLVQERFVAFVKARRAVAHVSRIGSLTTK